MGFFTKDSLQIIVFKSYGTNNHFYTRGRALEDERINLEISSFFGLLFNSWKRFKSDEIKNTALTITLPSKQKIETITDDDGYFLVDQKIENLLEYTNHEDWFTFKIGYSSPKKGRKINNENQFFGEILIPSKKAEFGIISDIDDTILHTGVTSKLKWRLLVNTFFRSPAKRMALKGAAEFYEMLHLGISGKNANPFFYVSHSPWNLYNYLSFFLKKNKFPKGAILLRSVSDIFKSRRAEKPRKQHEIINILKTYTDKQFILIGDAGEHDTDIYIEIARAFPIRIKAIFLVSVPSKKRMNRIHKILETYTDTPFYIINSSKEAIEFAKKENLIA